jgi:hypothetical protein
MHYEPNPVVIKHYQWVVNSLCVGNFLKQYSTPQNHSKGEFNRDYDRGLNMRSLKKFLQDPTGDRPWEEEPEAANIVHVDDRNMMQVVQQPQTLVFFYAPWVRWAGGLQNHRVTNSTSPPQVRPLQKPQAAIYRLGQRAGSG